jgi:hypothetical protein
VKFFPDDPVELKNHKKKKRVRLGCLDTKPTHYDRNPRVPDHNDRQLCRNPGCFPSNFAGNYSDEKERREREKLEHNMPTKLKNKLYLK